MTTGRLEVNWQEFNEPPHTQRRAGVTDAELAALDAITPSGGGRNIWPA